MTGCLSCFAGQRIRRSGSLGEEQPSNHTKVERHRLSQTHRIERHQGVLPTRHRSVFQNWSLKLELEFG